MALPFNTGQRGKQYGKFNFINAVQVIQKKLYISTFANVVKYSN